MAKILDGRILRDKILNNLAQEVKRLKRQPKLAVVLVGDNPASKLYVKNKEKYAKIAGIETDIVEMDKNASQEDIIYWIEKLNNNSCVDAILLQLPLPKHINTQEVIDKIAEYKDVDGFTTYNKRKLYTGEEPYVYPCTPQGILLLLDEYGITVEGKHAVVIGRSNIVGRPLAQMLLDRNATVTVCHSHTKNLEQITKTADIIISAVGKNIIKGEMLKNNSVVIDVGIFKDEHGKLRGDVDFDSSLEFASHITPVPGGVGPMTIASLMLNTVKLYKQFNRQ